MIGHLLVSAALGSCVLLGNERLCAEERERATAQARSWTESVEQAVARGNYLPLSLTPEIDGQTAIAAAHAGYDGARDQPTLHSFAQATVYGPLALRLGVASVGAGRLAPSAGARVQLLKQSDHGLALAASLFYKTEGFSELEGELESVLSVSRRFDAWLLLSTLAYGQDPEGNERDAEASLACLRRLSRQAHAGVEGRGRFGLGSLRAMSEPVADFQAGPVLNLALGPFALSAQGGVAVVRGLDRGTRVGAVASAGVGSAF